MAEALQLSCDLTSAKFALEQWGAWCRSGLDGPRPEKSWMGAFLDRLKERALHQQAVYQIWEEDKCELFDLHVMRRVKAINPDAFQALKLYYAYPSSDDSLALSKQHLANRLKVDRRTAAKRLEVGENMVAVMLVG